ncbi:MULTISPECIES: GntR family transcriptional regulator [Streptomyces]|uniref:GntR family transcriptional regulator n=1 Tax=Streptomyces TaxID=1883 RepID=UPI001CCBBF3E|nr:MULTISPECIES: GntR family transcriptional regulator [Streptomyces]MBZ6136355.1 GntR family transcriptional regulator [Streptomyces olivaceus]MBZ6163647.1 GntR family transcriptional regulator [Streptomyces olivaceus]MBZ6170962.1 GntR family transcriptional regulator [Streptomyces olivaceus]MBZ6177612.1 GntR family transcriptional regulator [Streptomyces olivaceus]MCM8549910.1 GntR family transcriptional regulator [Streptomyces sp. STCH 565 A]
MQEPTGRSVKRLPKASMQARVAGELREMIISGELPPRSSLSEMALSETFGISRTPIREALKQLQTEGLVEIRPRVGTFVAVPSHRDVAELFQMKELLEGAAARLLALRGRVPETERLQGVMTEADEATRAGDTDRYARLVHEFHELIVVGADNGKLEAHYRTLMNQLAYARLVRVTLAQPGRIHESDHEHHQVLDLIQAKDGNGAERMMREHVRRSHQALLAGWDAEEDITSPGTPPQGVGGAR